MEDPKSQQTIERMNYARMSAAYFFYFIAFGLFVPYFPAYLRERGLDVSAVGWFIALAPLARVVVPPLVGFIADRRRGPRFWGAVFAWGAVAGLSLAAASSRLALLAGMILFSASTAPTIPLLDAAAVRSGAKRFGSIRLWGSCGYLLTSFGLGYSFPSIPGATVLAALLAAHALFAAFLSLPDRREEATVSRVTWADALILCRDSRIWLLLSTLFLNRVASAPFNGFYTIFVQDLGLSGRVVALTWGLAITTEVAAMLIVDKALGRYGTSAVLAAGVGLEAVRWLAYSSIRSESGLLLLAPLHGLAFALLYVASVRCVTEIVPEGLRALGQGVSTTAAGLGQTIGIVTAGYLYQGVGSSAMFIAAGSVGGAAVVSALLLGRMTAKSSSAWGH